MIKSLIFIFIFILYYIYVTTPPYGHPLKSYDFVSSSLGIAKVNFVSALAHSSTLIEGEL